MLSSESELKKHAKHFIFSMALKLTFHFPIFFDPNPNPNTRSSSELRFSRWSTAKSHRETPSRSTSPPRRGKNSKNPPNPNPNVDSESHPAFRFSNIPKSRPRPVSTAPENVKISDDGMSYVIDGAPFEFKYSYTETPKVKPVKIREPPFVPFGPATMPRPWTGRAPLPPSKKKLKEFDSFVLPPPHKKGVKPVQSPGPFLPGTNPRYVKSREEILGEPLTKEEISDLVRGCIKTDRQLNIGRDGLTHNMLDNIHAHWKRRRVCKIRCKGVCTVDMDNVCEQLEERTGGKIIYRRGGVLYLFRGRNYNYRTRPHFPLMLWKPVPPVYPRLVNRVPEGLTLEEATEMRQKGRMLIPICKLGKNGVYCNLVKNVREAFEECDLVRINCQGLNKSDYRKIGAKLRDLVPCTLLSFENEHILMWRGRDWKSSLPDLGDGSKEDNKIDVDNENYKTLPSETVEDLAPCLQRNSVEHISNLSHETSMSSNSSDVTSDKAGVLYPTESNKQPVSVVTYVAPYPTENNKQSVSEVTNIASLTKSDDAETMNDAAGSCGEPEPCTSTSPSTTSSHYDSHAECPSKAIIDSLGTEDVMDSESCSDGLSASVSGSDVIVGGSGNHINGMVDPHAEKLPDGSRVADTSLPSRPAAPCMEGILLLLDQAVDKGSALVLDKDSLDADNIYQTTVAFAKSAPPGPVFRKHRKVAAQKSDKQEGTTLMSDKQEGTTLMSDKQEGTTLRSDKQEGTALMSNKQEGTMVEAKESKAVSMKGKRGKSSKIPKRENSDERFLNVVPQGTLGVDELAKLLT